MPGRPSPSSFASFLVRQGVTVALLLLILGLSILPMAGKTPLTHLQGFQFDLLQQLYPRDRSEIPVLVVAIDEESLARLGQWPWPRQTLANLVDKVNSGKPLAIGLDMVFPEPDRQDPRQLQKLYPKLDTRDLPYPDRIFAKALNSAPSVLGIAATDKLSPCSQTALRVTPIISRGGDSAAVATHFAGALTNLPELAAAAHGQALLNPRAITTLNDPERGVIRHMPLVASISGLPIAALGPEMLRVAMDESAVVAHLENDRITRVSVGEYSLPTQPDGSVILHFGALQEDRYISALDILDDRFSPENFKDRFVLIGFTGVGLQDLVVTPLGEKIPGVDAHAQVIESLISGNVLNRPQWIQVLEGFVLLALGVLMLMVLPRTSPTGNIRIGLLTIVLLFGLSHLFFLTGRLLLDASSIIMLLSPVFLFLFGRNLIKSERQRRQAEKNLQASRESAARIAGELDAAHRIQVGLLPNPGVLFEGETRFDLAAHLEPAKEVGGDYFDCFMLDDHRLCVAIGDVSGKGLPASLFMAMTKSVSEALLRQYPGDLTTAMIELDAALSRNNKEMLFVTAFVGVLDLYTGYLKYTCAGHNAPYILSAGTLQLVPVAHINGPPLCTYIGGFPYKQGRIQLKPGDFLVMVTDGVTEASNGDTWFGSDRLEKILREASAQGTDAQSLTEKITAEVRSFEAGTPAFDDLTLLVLKWRTPSQHQTDLVQTEAFH